MTPLSCYGRITRVTFDMTGAIGIDIGGTKINFVLVDGKRVLKTRKILTPQKKAEIFRLIKNNVKELIFGFPREKIKGIGIGVPGPLHKERGVILNPPNLKSLKNCPLAKIIEKETGVKSKMENDANCFALGEALLGAGRGAKTVLGITLGTGVGGGVVINGKIHRGDFGSAGEIGHMTIKFDGPRCSCSAFGCLEEYCSERFFLKRGGTPKEFKIKAENGGKKALKIYNQYGYYLGVGLAGAINLLDPEVIVIGGGISMAEKLFLRQARKEIKKRVISPVSKKCVKIKTAALGEFSGAVGAALLNYN